jgi:hypothetical protein
MKYNEISNEEKEKQDKLDTLIYEILIDPKMNMNKKEKLIASIKAHSPT